MSIFKSKNRKIANKIILLSIGSLIFLGIVVTSLFSILTYQSASRRILELDTLLRKDFDQKVKEEIETVISLLDAVYKKHTNGEYSLDEAKKLSADLVRELRYGQDGYFWIDTEDGTTIVYLGRADEGKNRISALDKKGNQFIQEAITKGINGGGYTNYWFPKPGGGKAMPKRSYSLAFKPYGWVVGSGNYIDDIEFIIKTEKENQNAEIRNLTITISLFVIVTLIISAIIAIVIGRKISRPIVELSKNTVKIAKGNLNVSMIKTTKDETGLLVNSINNMVSKLREIISSIMMESNNLANSSSQIHEIAEQLAQGAGEQAASTEEISASMEQMMANIAQNADNANSTGIIANEVNKKIIDVKKSFKETLVAMQNIAKKIDVVNEIAEKTDLLAINAAIEAARAGVSGKGFAVVANEVRKLSVHSQKAASEIIELSRNSVIIAERSWEILETTIPDIQKTTMLINEISIASAEQNSGGNQINNAVQQLVDVTNQNSSTSEEMSTGASELSRLANQLKDTISYFSLDGSGSSRKNVSKLKEHADSLMDVIHKIYEDNPDNETKNEISKHLTKIKEVDTKKEEVVIDMSDDNEFESY